MVNFNRVSYFFFSQKHESKFQKEQVLKNSLIYTLINGGNTALQKCIKLKTNW